MGKLISISINYKLLRKYLSVLTPLIFAIVLMVSFAQYSVNFVETKTLRDTLANVEPIFLSITFSLILILLVLNFKDIRKRFRSVGIDNWILLIIILCLAFVLRMYITPHTHRVYFDEDIYLDIGKEILIRGKGSLCNYGDMKGCYEHDFMKWPNGYPFVLAVTYMFFGINETIAYDLTAIIGSLSVVLMFFVAYLLYKNERLALYAALFLALTPVHIMWSGTTASEPFLMFFALLAVFCLLLSFEFNSLKMTSLSIVSLAYAMQIKAEGIFLLPIVAVFIFFLDRNWMKKLKNYKFLFLWILFFILITPYLIHTIFAEKTDPWGSEGNKFGFEHAKKNIPENLWFWVFGYPTIEHPTLFTFLAFFGLMYCLKKESAKCLSIVFWFATFFLIYGFFYAGSVRYGTDVRYALSEYPPLILLAVCGVGALTKFFMKNRINIHAFDILLLAIILLSFYYLYLPSVSTPADKIMEAYGARHYHDFVIENANKLNDNCCILSHVPSIYLVMDKCSLQTWNGQNEVKSEELFSKTNCVIFDDGYWCTLSPYKESVCKYMFDKYELKIIDQFKDTVEQRIYTFYKVSKPKV